MTYQLYQYILVITMYNYISSSKQDDISVIPVYILVIMMYNYISSSKQDDISVIPVYTSYHDV